MRKPILAALLTTNLMAAQAASVSPLPQFVQQCLANPPVAIDTISKLDTETAASELEQALLMLFNFNDKLSYFRQGANPNEKNLLLQCQVHLADELDSVATAPSLSSVIKKFETSDSGQYQALAKALYQLQKQQLSSAEKSRLYTAQAAYRQALKSASMRLQIPEGKCQLPPEETGNQTHSGQSRETDSGQQASPIDISIARYLLKQPDGDCRQQVWQAYQSRSAERNQLAMEEITRVRQEQAKQHKASNAADFALQDEYLNSPALVASFLQGQTRNIHLTPWDLGRALKAIPKARFEPLSQYTLIALLIPPLEELGLEFEQPSPQIYRVWYQGRLLGEMHLGESFAPASYVLVRPVVGRQFGTVLTLLPDQISSARMQHQAIETLAQSLATLSASQPFYLLVDNEESSAIGARWLTLWLSQQLTKLVPQAQDKRYQLMTAYSGQLKLFRAKLALADASGMDKTRLKQQAGIWFKQSFGAHWPDAIQGLAGFTGLAEVGVEYYLPLWQDAVAQMIFTQSQCCISPQQVYNTLLINPKAANLASQLEALLQEPAQPETIIRRLSYDR